MRLKPQIIERIAQFSDPIGTVSQMDRQIRLSIESPVFSITKSVSNDFVWEIDVLLKFDGFHVGWKGRGRPWKKESRVSEGRKWSNASRLTDKSQDFSLFEPFVPIVGKCIVSEKGWMKCRSFGELFDSQVIPKGFERVSFERIASVIVRTPRWVTHYCSVLWNDCLNYHSN